MNIKGISKLGIVTVVSFMCVNTLSSMNNVQAATTDAKTQTQRNTQAPDVKNTEGIYQDKSEGKTAETARTENNLGVASEFHIFSKKTNMSVDVNGNVATKELNDQVDFGTRGDNKGNQTKKDINYIGKIDSLHHGAFRNPNGNHLILGEGHKFDVNKDNRVYFDGNENNYVESNHLKKNDVTIEQNGQKYIDIDNELMHLSEKSDHWNEQETSKGVSIDFQDQNRRTIDLTNATPDKNNNIYVNLIGDNVKAMSAANPIYINGLGKASAGKKAPVVIINVKSDSSNLNVGTQIKMKFIDGSEISPNEGHDHNNLVLWNFGNDIKELNINGGYMLGSVLAPKATINVGVNTDGNIIANTVNIKGGESHRWDLQNNGIKKFPHFNHNQYFDFPPVPVIPHADGGEEEEVPGDQDHQEKPKGETPKNNKPTEGNKPKENKPKTETPKKDESKEDNNPKETKPKKETPKGDKNKPSTGDRKGPKEDNGKEKPKGDQPKGKEDHGKHEKPKGDTNKPGIKEDKGKKDEEDHHEGGKPKSTNDDHKGSKEDHGKEKPKGNKPNGKEDHDKHEKPTGDTTKPGTKEDKGDKGTVDHHEITPQPQAEEYHEDVTPHESPKAETPKKEEKNEEHEGTYFFAPLAKHGLDSEEPRGKKVLDGGSKKNKKHHSKNVSLARLPKYEETSHKQVVVEKLSHKSNSNESKELPKTGSVDTVLTSVFGMIVSAFALTIFDKKKN